MNQAEDQRNGVIAQSAASESESVTQKRYFGTTLVWHWVRTVFFLLLAGENLRLLLTQGATPRRVIVLTLVALVFAYLLIMLIRALRQKARDNI